VTDLVAYDAMCRAIDQALAVDEVKEIRDRAVALAQYQRQANNIEAESQCCRIRLRAERKAGELLKAMALHGEREGRGGDRKSKSGGTTLNDLGISRDQSALWQGLAEVPEKDFEAAIAGDRPTSAAVLEKARPKAVTPVDDGALWLWGRLKDFERNGLLARDPETITETMTEPMLADVKRLAPLVADWLGAVAAGGPS
jgi:hypothetical protein